MAFSSLAPAGVRTNDTGGNLRTTMEAVKAGSLFSPCPSRCAFRWPSTENYWAKSYASSPTP
jgi:hypothetical protein